MPIKASGGDTGRVLTCVKAVTSDSVELGEEADSRDERSMDAGVKVDSTQVAVAIALGHADRDSDTPLAQSNYT